MKKYLLIILLLISGSLSLIAQDERFTEEDVNIQKVFIEAQREKFLENYENAAYLYKEVLRRDKDNDAAAYELARIYDTLNNDDKAIKSIKTAIALDNKNVWYQQYLADLYKKTNQNEEAATIFENLVKAYPNNTAYYFKWAYFLINANEIQKAIKVYDDLEGQIGINEEVVRRKHTLYIGLGNNKKAARELQNLIEAFPDNIEYRHLLAEYYELIGEKKTAQGVYEQILALDPSDPKASIALAEVKNKDKSDLSYLYSLKPIFEKPDLNIDIKIKELFPYISKVVNTGDKNLAAAALELSEILEATHPNEAKAFSVSGDLLYYSDDAERALKKYQQTIELDEGNFLVWEQIMRIYSDSKDYDELLKVSEEVLDIFPNQARGYYFHALAHTHQQNHRAAISNLETALMMVGRNLHLEFDIQLLLGRNYFYTQQYDKSNAAFEAALKLNPKSAALLNEYSHSLSVQGLKLDKAKEMAAYANELEPTSGIFQDTYGWILYKLKEYEAAKNWLSRAIANGMEKNPKTLERLGDALFKTNDIEGAMSQWQKALEKGSQSDLLEKKIADKQLYE